MTRIHRTFIHLSLSLILAHVIQCTPIAKDVKELPVDIRLPTDTVPIHYNISLSPYMDSNFTFDGETNIEFEVRKPTDKVTLHALDLTIEESATTVTDKDGTVFVPKEHIYENDTQFLILRFDAILQIGGYVLHIKYNGTINDHLTGFYRTYYTNDEGEKVWLATTHFEPTTARMAFPCWDEPALKASFTVSVRHPANYTVISNMPVRASSEETGAIRTEFEKSPVMSTYLVDFVVADYARKSNADGTVNVWVRPNAVDRADLVLEYAATVQAELTRYMNSTARVPKMDHIAIPHYTTRATEHWGAITYVENAILYDEEVNTVRDKQGTAMIVAHELAHQWFGNIVSPLWWKHLWLSEAFAVYFQHYILDKLVTDWRLEESFVVDTVFSTAMVMDTSPRMPPISPDVTTTTDIRRTFHFITYRKGAAIVRMMSHILTEDVFRKAILDYMNAHEYGAATAEDLFAAMQKALDESDVPHDKNFNMTEAMLPWIEEANYPFVSVIRNYTTGEITITQESVANVLPREEQDKQDTKWWVPITYTTQSNPDFSSTHPTHWLKPTDEKLTIAGVDPNDWVIVNLQHTGHYWVDYDVTNWRRLAKYLNSANYTKIHPLNRAWIINGAYKMVEKGKLSLNVFLEITNYLSLEEDYIPWESAFTIIKIAFLYVSHPKHSSELKAHILSLMDHLIEKLGYEDVPGESDLNKLQRINLRASACYLGDNRCRANATLRLMEFVNNPNETKIPEDMEDWVFCSGMRNVNETVWLKLLDIYKDTQNSDITSALACVDDPVILEKYLNLLIADDSPISPKDAKSAYISMIGYNGDYMDLALDFFANNSNKIIASLPGPERIVDTIVNQFVTKEHLEKVKLLQRLVGIDFDIAWKIEEIENVDKVNQKLSEYLSKKAVTEPTIDNALT